MNDDSTGMYFTRLINTTYFLFKNEIPHTTNYSKLIGAQIVHDEPLREWLRKRPKNSTYDSEQTVTELLECCGSVIKAKVLSKVHEGIKRYNCYAYLGDETSYISRREQVCHVVRYLDNNGQPNESFIGLDHAKQHPQKP